MKAKVVLLTYSTSGLRSTNIFVNFVFMLSSCTQFPDCGANDAKAAGLSKAGLLRTSAKDASLPATTKKKQSQIASPSSARAKKQTWRSCSVACVTRDRQCWRAQTCSVDYLGAFQSESGAAIAVAHRLEVRQADLRRTRAKTTDVDDHIEKFKLLLGVYTDTDSDKISVMSDLASAARATQK